MDFQTFLKQYETIHPKGSVKFEGHDIGFHTPNTTTMWRLDTLFTKEPDTIRWLSAMAPDEVLVDIGANVGMYSILSAVGRGVRVFAFEPESQNYGLLNRNIELNGAQERVTAYCAALLDHSGADKFYLGEFMAGGSCHAAEEPLDFNLNPLKPQFVQGCILWTLDELIADGAIPVPSHIKIDVDGFEHKVIAGMANTLTNPEVKSVLIELNPHLAEHRDLFRTMEDLGFHYFENQAEESRQPAGPFKGIGNIIFYRPGWAAYEALYENQSGPIRVMDTFNEVLSKIAAAEIITEPTPHIHIDNIFPEDFYRNLLAMLPNQKHYVSIAQSGRVTGYDPARDILSFDTATLATLDGTIRPFWTQIATALLSQDLVDTTVTKFSTWLPEANGSKESLAALRRDAMLIRDKKDYELGPHTDTPGRMLSLLFYLPEDGSQESAGTALYRPLDESFTCTGSKHHPFDDFREVYRFPFRPNSMVGFVRTNTSFHGVPVFDRGDEVRNTIGYLVARS